MTQPTPQVMSAADEITRLLGIMAALRDPTTGCPWDQAQTFDSIVPYTIEEAYEVADAIARRDWTALPDELGDLLLQIVYYASMAETEGRFDFAAVARAIADKMVRRHPHVFGDAASAEATRHAPQATRATMSQAVPDPTPEATRATVPHEATWEAIKATERRARAEHGTLAGIPIDLPALTRAARLGARAARVGFDWPEPVQVLDKLDEELAELRAELDGADPARLQDELGDVLFTLSNLTRKLGLDPESCLRHANAKFQRRFQSMEAAIEADGQDLPTASPQRMEAAWQAVKRSERAPPAADQPASSVS